MRTKATEDLPEISVMDFATQLIESGNVTPISDPTPAAISDPMGDFNSLPKAPDISHVEVPDDFVRSITGSAPKKTQKIVEEKSPSKKLEERAQEIITQLNSLLVEAREVVKEMTTVGTIGVNMGGPVKKTTTKKKKKIPTIENKVESILKKMLTDLD